MKHKLISNFDMKLDSIQSQLTIAEDVDCRSGTVALMVKLKTNELEVKLETSYRLKGDYELKYYRNQQMMKHILNGNLVIDEIANEELVSLMKIDDNNNISNLAIISLDFFDEDKKLISRFTKDKTNRLIIDKRMKIPELTAQNMGQVSSGEVALKSEDEKDEEEDDDNQSEDENRKWRLLSMPGEDQDHDEPTVHEETTPLENVGKAVTGIIEKGLGMFDTTQATVHPDQKNFDDKKENDQKKPDPKTSPYFSTEGMS